MKVNNDMTYSIRFGFIGVGMGGSSIASACADTVTNITNDFYPYSSLLINTNKIDLEKIDSKNPNTKKMVIGNGKGAGRNIELGKNIFVQHSQEIQKEIESRFQQTEFVWLVAGLGGGTGTGSVIEAIRILMTSGFRGRFGLILTLPRTNEGQIVIQNALDRLEKIHRAMNGLGSIILVDNQKLFDEYSKEHPTSPIADYLNFSNRFVAETLHELNVVTSSYKPYGEFNFDSSEFENLIKTPGILHFARFVSSANEVDAAQFISHGGKLKEQIENGVLSTGYNLAQTKKLAVSILTDKVTAQRIFNFQFIKPIEETLEQMAPLSQENPIAQYIKDENDPKKRNVHFYAAFAGLQLPNRVTELIKENNRLLELQKNNSVETEDVFASFKTAEPPTSTNDTLSFEDLFSENPTSQDTVKKEITNDEIFNSLFNEKE